MSYGGGGGAILLNIWVGLSQRYIQGNSLYCPKGYMSYGGGFIVTTLVAMS